MKRMRRWSVLMGLTCALYGVSCGTMARDAVATGVLDFITGFTTDTLSGVVTGVGGGNE